jgi:hypothetical protein
MWSAIVGLFRSRAALQAEILILRHQLNVLRSRSPRRVAVSNVDRAVFVGLYRLVPKVLDGLKIVQPETLVSWHRAGIGVGDHDGRSVDQRSLRTFASSSSR